MGERASMSGWGSPCDEVSRFTSRLRHASKATGTLRGVGIFSTITPSDEASMMTRSSADCVTSRSRSLEKTVSPNCRA